MFQFTAAAVSWEEMMDVKVAIAITATIIQIPAKPLPTQETGATSPYPTCRARRSQSERARNHGDVNGGKT